MSKAQELALLVVTSRHAILNRDTVRQCRLIYSGLMEQAEQAAKLGAYVVKGEVQLDPAETYDVATINNQLKLKLEAEEFEHISINIEHDDDGKANLMHFNFTIPELKAPPVFPPVEVNFGF